MHHNVAVNLARASAAFTPPSAGSARADLIATAERLFADRGIEGVSLRTICAQSNQGNTRALQYHFKDRAGIVAAILLTRMRRIEERRGELLAAMLASGDQTIAAQIDVLLRPISEFVGEDGRNLFARFLLHVTTHSHTWGWSSLHHLGMPEEGQTATEQVYDLLRGQLGDAHGPLADKRMSHILRMFLGALIDRENTLLDGGKEASLEDAVEDQIAMAAAALTAPGRADRVEGRRGRGAF